ncbi:8-oxo-dGTP diphosphatase MutT [Paenibacillus sp. VCA1]|uniref:8-oxo-dGTP diphosphatase MutT n=1 Tax=Paenibacillus sp. VCA1 TaxID=3039148 RepID=UPI0028722A69|nr:8-oxo-dGTP diphosphatase MutT [Paenibacillus sp. VCA1]MDR9855793.1 8-oxo-dGTP diphosphatase MutT [Paenibacillus sp. VCA1]
MIQVAAAIIENEQGQVLIARKKPGKPQAGLWEFPGGKLESGESPIDCLKRELREEMQITIEPYAWFGTNDHHYGEKHIRLIAYKARFIDGTIQLVDHDEVRWVKRHELGEYAFAPADVKFVEMLAAEAGCSIGHARPAEDATVVERGIGELSSIKSTLKQAYDNHADLRNAAELEGWKAEERDNVLNAFQSNDVHSVLEIGAGPGRDSLFFKKHGFDVTAVDLSEEMVRLCRQKGLSARVMDFYHLEFADRSFDAVYAMNCLLHVPKAQLPGVLTEIKRVLKPGGLFYLGLYGGMSTDGIWEQDTYEPKRYFAMYPDEEIQRIIQIYFQMENFHTRDMGEGSPHFQGMLLRN